MNTKTIAVISAITVFAIGLATPAMAVFVDGISAELTSVEAKNKNTSILSVDADSDIPRHTSDLGGFAWLYLTGDPHTAFVTATHEGVRDSHQNPDGWHAHNVILDIGVGTGSDACITEIADDPRAGIAINGDEMKANVKNKDITGTLTGAGAAFEIVIDPSCPTTIPTASIVPGGLNLGVKLQ